MNARAFSFPRAGLAWLIAMLAGVAHAADTQPPLISLSLRGVADRTVEQGEPLSVAVRLTAPPQESSVIELAPSSGTWVDAVSVEIASGPNAIPIARATAVGRPDSPRATLDRNRIAGGLWIFSSAAMQGLAPGDYVVRVRLKVEAGTGWKGEAVSNALLLKVVAPSAATSHVTQRALSRANEAMLADRGEEAAGILDAVLLTSPDNRDVLLLRAMVADRAGNLTAALLCVNRAARGLSANGPPPSDLFEARTRLQAKLLQPQAESEKAPPPSWSWPPVSVLRSPPETQRTKTNQVSAPASAPPASAAAPNSAPRDAASASTLASAPAPATGSLAAPNPGAASPGSGTDRVVASTNAPGMIVPPAELSEAKILADAAGQWASAATAGSQYGRTQYSAMQATGAPNINVQGNSPDAWCPAGKNEGTDWLVVSFAKPVHAIEVRVRQNDTPGAIAKIEAMEPDGTTHVWWEGADPAKASAVREIVWFAVRVPKTSYLVARVKLTLNLASGPGWKEIDAVQLVAAAGDK
jgi:hypothetical protein